MKITRVYIETLERMQIITDSYPETASRIDKPRNIVEFSFSDLNYKVKKINSTKHIETKIILDGVTGYCPGGQVTAILGCSGAGKTTLLNILAFRVPQNRDSILKGKIQANGQEYNYDSFSQFASYVMQSDVLLETMTPREAFTFVANLKYVDKDISTLRVEEAIKSMRLEKCQNTLIGGITMKGISGGEKKRTSIGFELVSNPSCVLLDEPTSGLDSFTAFSIVYELKQLAIKQNKTIVFTIHSPSADIFQLFDRIMLLENGKFIYQGHRAEVLHFKKLGKIVDYFRAAGFKCPQHSNPMDYFLGIMNTSNTESVNNLPILQDYYNKNCHPNILTEIAAIESSQLPIKVNETSIVRQLQVISRRNFIRFQRDPMQFIVRLFQAVAQGLLLGGVFWKVGEGSGTISDLFGVSGSLFFCVLNLMISSILSVILSFSIERDVFLREENAKLYSLSSYFIGKQILEIPLSILLPLVQELIAYWMCSYQKTSEALVMHLFASVLIYNLFTSLGTLFGCLFSDLTVLLGVAPLTQMPQILFSGYLANPKNFYSWTKWLQYISPITYSFQLLSRIEYQNQVYQVDPIEMFDFKFEIWTCVYVLIGFILFYRILAFFTLFILKQKLQ